MTDDKIERLEVIILQLSRLSVPLVVVQALDDTQLPPAARLAMWHLRRRLDVLEFREVYAVSIAAEMRVEPQSAGRSLRLLTEKGYLEEHAKRRPRAYRFPQSRRVDMQRAA